MCTTIRQCGSCAGTDCHKVASISHKRHSNSVVFRIIGRNVDIFLCLLIPWRRWKEPGEEHGRTQVWSVMPVCVITYSTFWDQSSEIDQCGLCGHHLLQVKADPKICVIDISKHILLLLHDLKWHWFTETATANICFNDCLVSKLYLNLVVQNLSIFSCSFSFTELLFRFLSTSLLPHAWSLLRLIKIPSYEKEFQSKF